MYDKNVKIWLEEAGYKKSEDLDLTSSKIRLALALIEEEVKELKDAVYMNDPIEVIDAIVDIKWVVNNLIHFAGIKEEDINFAESEVLRSNLSKFCKTETEALDTVQAYRDGIHWDKKGQKIETYYEKHGQHYGINYVIKRSSDNKIMKSLLYKKPKLSIHSES